MIPHMKKLLLIFLLAILPLQFSWAAAAVYCQHENEVNTQHIGHHEHQHKTSHADDESKDSSKIKLHADCVSCHGSTASFAILSTDAQLHAPSAHVIAADAYMLNSTHLSRPERPKWSLAV